MHLHLNHNWTGSNSRRSPNFSGLFRRPFSVRAPHSGFKWLKSATKQLQICFPFLSNLCIFKVWTFWETHKIWKNLPYGFNKSADLLSKLQNHKADFFKCVCFSKSLNFTSFPFPWFHMFHIKKSWIQFLADLCYLSQLCVITPHTGRDVTDTVWWSNLEPRENI